MEPSIIIAAILLLASGLFALSKAHKKFKLDGGVQGDWTVALFVLGVSLVAIAILMAVVGHV